MQKKMQKAIKTVGSLEFLDKMSPPGSPRIQHSRNSLDSLRSADQQMDLAGHEKNKLRGEIDGLGRRSSSDQEEVRRGLRLLLRTRCLGIGAVYIQTKRM